MASTARSKEEEREYFDNEEELDRKVTQLAEMIKKCKHFTVFTGAGISTSAGIPDFRSGLNTVLDTGAGAWAKKAAIQKGIDVKPKKKLNIKSTLNAIPTATHMTLVELNQQNILKYLISQNCDGLHRRSGYNPNAISELHGNTNLEFCKMCGKQYLRDFRVRRRKNHVHDHKTDRKCTKAFCGKVLYDTIINFGEGLNDWAWNPAEENADKSDCCLVLGSSLTVTPAADLPRNIATKSDSTFCIVNLQKTDLDRFCAVRIYAKCDDVMQLLMKKLDLQIPEWRLKRYIEIKIDQKQHTISVFGIDSDGTTYDILSLIRLIVKKKVYEKKGKCLDGEIFKVHKAPFLLKKNEMYLELGFMQHYNEPNVMIDMKKYWTNDVDEFVLNLSYNPYEGIWGIKKVGKDTKDLEEEKKNDDNEDENEIKEHQQEGVEDIYVGNMHELANQITKRAHGDNQHIWTMFVSTNKGKLVKSETIKEVRYELHPSFKTSRITVKKAPFLLRRKGWGTFNVIATIVFNENAKRKDLVCSHYLDFDHNVTMTHISGKDSEVEDKIIHVEELVNFLL